MPSSSVLKSSEPIERDEFAERLTRSIQSAQEHLLSLQASDGHWCGELEGDTILESEYCLTMHFLGRTAEERVRKAANYLREKQRPEGGWAIYPGGPAEVSASVKAYFVLKLLGDRPEGPHLARARQAILELGGLDACNSFTKIYLAIFGQYPWSKCPSVPPELMLLPRGAPLNIYAMSSWSRGILVPLSVISAKRPSCPVPDEAGIAELWSPSFRPKPRTGWSGFFYATDALLKHLEKLPFGQVRRIAIARAERWMLERLEGSDGIGAIFPPIINTIIALRALGYPPEHPTVQAQVRELERLEIEESTTLRLQPCFSPVWDTAYAMAALADAGLAADHPALHRAARWMVDKRGHDRGDWRVTTPHMTYSGFYFEYANPYYPDCDTTAQAISALNRVDLPDGEENKRCQAAIFEAHEWHLAMQNADGGWAAFDRGCDGEYLTKVPFADHNAMIDPSTADVTARGLDALATLGFGPEYPPARRALGFLRGLQEPDGSWYGRWGCNYVYGTYLALFAFRRMGEDPSAPQMRRGADWLRQVQNEDGGWGESLRSYDEPSYRGRGPSTAAQTAWAVLGLMAAGERDSQAVRRGITFLLSRQQNDGRWRDTEWTGTGFPRVFYLNYHLYALYFPLMALGTYIRSLKQRARPGRQPGTQRHGVGAGETT